VRSSYVAVDGSVDACSEVLRECYESGTTCLSHTFRGLLFGLTSLATGRLSHGYETERLVSRGTLVS